MKPKDYIKKYPWVLGEDVPEPNGDYSVEVLEFIKDLKTDFINVLEANKLIMSSRRFEFLLTSEFKDKYKTIVYNQNYNSYRYVSFETLWNYIVEEFNELKGLYIPEEILKREAEEKQKRDREARMREENRNRYRVDNKSFEDFMRSIFDDVLFNDFFRFYEQILSKPATPSFPTQAFRYFSIDVNTLSTHTINDVSQKFKQLALKLHPDKGGSNEAFAELIKMRDACISYLSKL